MIYLDYAATTPLDARVEEAMRPFGRALFANPSSPHTPGQQARAALDRARDTVAEALGALPEEIVFTSGGTEADNLAIKGAARARRKQGRHLIATAFEHHAVLESLAALEADGFRVTLLAPDTRGLVTAEQVADALTPETTLVSVMYANNEIGTIQPVAEIGRLCRARGVLFHTDAVQAAEELPLDIASLHVDLLSLSAHKLYGPKGAGVLFVRRGTPLQPLLHGGHQEYEFRAGTENVAGMVGLATALALRLDAAEIARIHALRERLIDGLLALPGSRLHGDRIQRLANNVNVGFDGVPGETLMVALDLEGIAVSTGAACAAGAATPSHVVHALGYSLVQSLEALRITLGTPTTEADILRTIEAVGGIVARMRR